MHRISYTICMLVCAMTYVVAQPSATYYQSAEGTTQVDLKLALKNIISDHVTLSYSGALPKAYESVYYQDDDPTLVYDMFSYDDYTFSTSNKWNKEHVIPNSWWNGERNAAYSDLYSVIPSEQVVNNRKSNYPIGTVSSITYDNGCIKVGRPVEGQGGTYNYVFEPADEYKGDFARIYFYVATCYSDIGWGTNSNVKSEIKCEDWPTLNPWLYKLLLKWHNQDPVSEKEIKINNSAEAIQHNRNPFIDYPVLADYIWGDYQSVEFCLDSVALYTHINGEHIDIVEEPTDTIGIVVPGEMLLAEYFDELTEGSNTTTNSSTSWYGNDNFSATTAYQAGGAVRLSTAKKAGQLTSRTINYQGGAVVVELAVKGWTTVEGGITVSIGGETKNVTYTSRMADAYQVITLEFNSVLPQPKLTIAADAGQRCFIDYVTVRAVSRKLPVDTNADGAVDTQDVLAVYEFMNRHGDGADISAFDVNGDGVVDTQDVLTIYQYISNQ